MASTSAGSAASAGGGAAAARPARKAARRSRAAATASSSIATCDSRAARWETRGIGAAAGVVGCSGAAAGGAARVSHSCSGAAAGGASVAAVAFFGVSGEKRCRTRSDCRGDGDWPTFSASTTAATIGDFLRGGLDSSSSAGSSTSISLLGARSSFGITPHSRERIACDWRGGAKVGEAQGRNIWAPRSRIRVAQAAESAAGTQPGEEFDCTADNGTISTRG